MAQSSLPITALIDTSRIHALVKYLIVAVKSINYFCATLRLVAYTRDKSLYMNSFISSRRGLDALECCRHQYRKRQEVTSGLYLITVIRSQCLKCLRKIPPSITSYRNGNFSSTTGACVQVTGVCISHSTQYYNKL